MNGPVLTADQQNMLAETVLVVKTELGINPTSTLAGMDAVRTLQATVDLFALETLLRTTGHNDAINMKLRDVSNGLIVEATGAEMTKILAMGPPDIPPCFNYAQHLDRPADYVMWAGSFPPSGLELRGRPTS